MMLILTMFLAGAVTILLPCILPLLPVVLGVSIAGRHRLRPLFVVSGMLVSFVGFTFLLQIVLSQFVETADYLRIATYYVLLLFGLGFLFHQRALLVGGAMLGSLFFHPKGWLSIGIAALLGMIAMELGGRIASRLQQWGTNIQGKTAREFGSESPMSAFIIGLTLGLIWVPCAGPALGFALALIREEPGLRTLLLLSAYGAGTAVPLLLVGYGGQLAIRSVRSLTPYSGAVKKVAGILLILTALALNFRGFTAFETYLAQNLGYGTIGTDLENALINDTFDSSAPTASRLLPSFSASSSLMGSEPSPLPRLVHAPELASSGPWHNSGPLTLKELKGKVVLIDFWTYSCINCIRTLPYIQGYWERYKDDPFMLIGVHSPEFVFEKSEANVRDAIRRHGLTYPIVQDNDFGTWRAFSNHYWPAKYLIDAEGYVRYTHFGEGDYEETNKAIMSLLKEIGAADEGSEPMQREPPAIRRTMTPETYLGERSWPALGNSNGDPTDAIISYSTPSALTLNRYYLDGDWQLLDGERQVLRSAEGAILIRALAGEVNLVLGVEDGKESVSADIIVDSKKTKTISIDHHDLYNLFKGEYGEHDIILRFHGKNVAGYAFTFGS